MRIAPESRKHTLCLYYMDSQNWDEGDIITNGKIVGILRDEGFTLEPMRPNVKSSDVRCYWGCSMPPEAYWKIGRMVKGESA